MLRSVALYVVKRASWWVVLTLAALAWAFIAADPAAASHSSAMVPATYVDEGIYSTGPVVGPVDGSYGVTAEFVLALTADPEVGGADVSVVCEEAGQGDSYVLTAADDGTHTGSTDITEAEGLADGDVCSFSINIWGTATVEVVSGSFAWHLAAAPTPTPTPTPTPEPTPIVVDLSDEDRERLDALSEQGWSSLQVVGFFLAGILVVVGLRR